VFHRYLAQFHIEVAGELFPAYLYGTRDEVRFVGWFSFFLPFFAPSPFHGQAAEHGGFARTDGRTSDGRLALGRVPEVGEYLYAAPLDFRRLGIFVLVYHVLVDAGVHYLADIGVCIGLAECGEVLFGIAVKQQFVQNKVGNDLRVVGIVGHFVFGDGAFRGLLCISVVHAFRIALADFV